jgi:hypothetical protein
LFSKKERGPVGVPPLGSGRRLRSSLPLSACLNTLEAIVWSYWEPQYPEMPAYFYAGWAWSTAAEWPRPDVGVCCSDAQDDFLFVAFWPREGYTEIGMFPLGGGDDRLSGISMVDDWYQRDSSLSSIGTVPARLITLTAPLVADDYCAELIGQRGFPPTDFNLVRMWDMVCRQFLVKSMQFISSKDQRAADRFADRHRNMPPGRDQAQRILNELADWDSVVLPYMQDIPMRIRALLLSDQSGQAPIWGELQR